MAALSANIDIVFGELLSQILAKSQTSDLIEYRLVSRRWSQAATDVLLKRSDLQIKFEVTTAEPFKDDATFYSFADDRSAFRYNGWKRCRSHPELFEKLTGDKTLPNLLGLVKSTTSGHQIASSLPINHFDFNFQHYDLSHCEFSAFIQVYGVKIKTLDLRNYDFVSKSHKGMVNLVLQYTPNLESLYIKQAFIDEELTFEPHKRVILPHLKVVKISHENRWAADWRMYNNNGKQKPFIWILQYVLENAPKLERISYLSYFETKNLEVFLPSKIHLLNIENLCVSGDHLFSSEGLKELEKLVKVMEKSPQGVGLKHLRICIEVWPQTAAIWKRGCSALRTILETNANSIEKIDLIGGAALILHKIPYLPVLHKVKELGVNLHVRFVFYRVSEDVLDFVGQLHDGFTGNSLSYLFPFLKNIDLLHWHCEDEDDFQWFPYWNDKLMQVKVLKVKSNDFLISRMTKAFPRSLALCPEINSFTTCWPSCEFHLLFQPLWSMKYLTSLHLEFFLISVSDSDEIVDFDMHLDLDAVLTGISRENVSAIYKNWEKCGRWEVPENLKLTRANSSLLNLPNLEMLHLNIRTDFDKEPQRIISGVSAKFGFDLIKNLKVILRFNFHLNSVRCSACDPEWAKEQWFGLHRPLSDFPNVIVGLEEDVQCCSILENYGHHDFNDFD